MGSSPLRIFSLDADGSDIPPDSFETILTILRNTRGFNLDIYKDKCIKRRIAIRIRKTGCSSAREYGELLKGDQAETDQLLKVITIHVSQFFRNPSTFERLRKDIFPYLFACCLREKRDSLSILSVGCAGGEEPYSVALLLKEFFAPVLDRINVSIAATDIDLPVLETARTGLYRNERLAEVPPEMRERWFCPENGHFRLAPEIREMVSFRQGDLYQMEDLSPSDLILCRNVLIYLERRHQERVLKKFAQILPKGRILVLGKSETLVGESRRLFQTVCPVERIYRTA